MPFNFNKIENNTKFQVTEKAWEVFMKHIGTKRIETKRLLLRPFDQGDAWAMFHHWVNDPAVTHFLTWEPHGRIEVTRELLLHWENRSRRPDYYNWAIVPYMNDAVQGQTAMLLPDDPVGGISVVQYSEEDQVGVVGYCLSKAFWGQGIMTEALGAVIHFLFHEVGFHRIEAQHDTNNPASGKVMLNCGMQREGVLRKAKFCPRRGFYDVAIYGILKEHSV